MVENELVSANEALAATKEELRKSQGQVLELSEGRVLKLRDGVRAEGSKGFHDFNVLQLDKFADDLKADGEKLDKFAAIARH